MPQFIDLTGKKFGKLTVSAKHPVKTANNLIRWECVCDCNPDKLLVIRGGDLRSGSSKSCGCVGREKIIERSTKHGNCLTGKATTEYITWCGMKTRCYNPNEKEYNNYGGRGIIVCDRWLNNFSSFLEDMGQKPAPKYELDRIDNNGNYEPANCRWANRVTQQNNKRNNHLITYNGETKTLAQWAKDKGLDFDLLRNRLKRWSVEDALNRPIEDSPIGVRKLSDEDYEEIKRLYLTGEHTLREIGKMFGATGVYVRYLVADLDPEKLEAIKIQHQRRGTRSASAKLDESKVREIRRIREKEGLKYRELAVMFGVSASTIEDIVLRKKWSWVE